MDDRELGHWQRYADRVDRGVPRLLGEVLMSLPYDHAARAQALVAMIAACGAGAAYLLWGR